MFRSIMRAHLTFFVALLLAAPAFAETRPVDPSSITVVDGDTIIIDGTTWRLMGYDTPETDGAKCEGERRLGLLARQRLSVFIDASTAMTITGNGEKDAYQRRLGRLSINGRDVGAILISELLARPYNGSYRKGWCSRDSRDDMPPGPLPARSRRQ
jgi:endonuclease YncB( thermonuclease family)